MPLALGALLVRVARADKYYVLQEVQAIDQILAWRYDLTLAEAAELRHQCETAEQDAPDVERFARLLREAVPYGERLAIALALWDVMLADGIQRPEEEAVVHIAETILGITRQDLPTAS